MNTPISTRCSYSSSNIGKCIWPKQLWMPIAILIFARFLRNFTCGCMIEWRLCMHKISEAYRLLAHGKPFKQNFLKEPRILPWFASSYILIKSLKTSNLGKYASSLNLLYNIRLLKLQEIWHVLVSFEQLLFYALTMCMANWVIKHNHNKITKTLYLKFFGHAAFIKQKVRWHSTAMRPLSSKSNCTVSSNFLLDKGRVAENLQKECLCYFIISSTSLWRNHFNHIHNHNVYT